MPSACCCRSVCTGAGLYVQSFVERLSETQSTFRDRQLRNGYVAMSDVQRLLMVGLDAVTEGELTPEIAREFADANDFLFVRTNNFRRTMAEGLRIASGAAAIEALNAVIAVADDALATDGPDVHAVFDRLLAASEEARRRLVVFLDDMRRESDILLIDQYNAVRNQQRVVLGNLVGLTFIGSVALLLLRKEVLGRQLRAEAEGRVDFLAFFDPLTRLPNRIQFQDRIEALLKQGEPVALLFIDLDDFKSINDTYGHRAGDAALRHIGGLLGKAAERYGGFGARLAGDEFALVVSDTRTGTLSAICDRLLFQTSEPFEYEGESFDLGLSIGVATSTQLMRSHKVTLDSLSSVTDFALYASKTAGRRRYTIFDDEIDARFRERRDLLEDLPKAIEAGELEAFLQPKVTLQDGRTYGFEALVRWRRGDRIVPPDEFILVAEESGLVVDIDHYMLLRASRAVADWNRAEGQGLSVSVNLSALHFSSNRIVEWVEEALWHSGLPAHLLTLEITETLKLRDWDQAMRVVEALQNLGVRIAIDDFGTGFSSLAYLRTTRANELKIDRSLVEELETSDRARRLLGAVLDIARILDLEVTVEGIETVSQARLVAAMGAPKAQGYLFGRPLPAEEALAATAAPLSARAI